MKIKLNPTFLRRFLVLLLVLSSLATTAFAQAPEATPEMADALRENGKIYVVVAAVFIIMAGMLTYLVVLDRKVSRLERESSNR